MDTASLILIIITTAFLVKAAVVIALETVQQQFLTLRGRELPLWLTSRFEAAVMSRAFAYSAARSRLGIISEILETAVCLGLLWSGAFGLVDRRMRSGIGMGDQDSVFAGVLYICIWLVIATVAKLPLSYYSTFVLEHRFGFNRSTRGRWIKDQVLGLVLGLVLVGLISAVLLVVMQSSPLWWAAATIVTLLFIALMQVLFPTVIAPMFNRFRPLGDTALASDVEEMCRRLEFPIAGVFEIDGSTRSTKSNAYVAGLGKMKRIALFDTLLSSLGREQILAVLAHEIGHSKHRHALKGMLLAVPQMALFFFALDLVLDYPPFFAAFGADVRHYNAIVLFQVIASPILYFMSPLASWLSRRFEFEADRYARTAIGSPEPLVEGLLTLTESNLGTPIAHPIYSAFYDSHPRLVARIEALRSQK